MKELSIEEKAKAYDNIIEKANKMHSENCEACQMCIEELIPELKKSEDERIRKWLVEELYKSVNSSVSKGFDIDMGGKALAWLEKQYEHSKFYDSIQVGDKVTRNKDGVLVNLSQLKRVAKPAEVQGEQKPIEPQQDMLSQEKYAKAVDECIYEKPTDKVEPKFNVGDEIKTANEESLIITKIDEKGYWSEDLFICDFDEECIWDLVEQPVWNEEDEKIYAATIFALAGFMGNEDKIDWLKSIKDRYTWKPSDLPHWKKSTLPNDNTTGFNSDYFCHKGYSINYKELFEKLPKDD